MKRKMYGGGVLVVAFLATALIAGNASCSNSSDDSDYEIDDDQNQPDDTNFGGGKDEVTQPSQWPAYYIDEEFGGQRFVDTEDWYHDDQNVKNQKFIARYNNADQFINSKVAELQKMWKEQNTGSALSNQIGTALDNFNRDSAIAQQINGNYDALATVFKAMRKTLATEEDLYRFCISYQKLAADAFNQSIGKAALNESKMFFKTNVEMEKDDYNYLAGELVMANLSYADATDRNQAKERMNSYLNIIASETNTDTTVLEKVVELALYNESLYGLNDFAVQCQVDNQDLKKNQRRLDMFEDKILRAAYNPDDHMM